MQSFYYKLFLYGQIERLYLMRYIADTAMHGMVEGQLYHI